MIRYIKEALLFVALLFILSTAVSLYRTSSMSIRDDVCKNGAQIVYFWATWCPVCKMTSPNVQRVSQKFHVLAIAVRSGDTKRVTGYMQKEGLKFPIFNDTKGTIAHQNGVEVLPTFVFCKNEKVKIAEAGYISTFGIWLRSILFTN